MDKSLPPVQYSQDPRLVLVLRRSLVIQYWVLSTRVHPTAEEWRTNRTEIQNLNFFQKIQITKNFNFRVKIPQKLQTLYFYDLNLCKFFAVFVSLWSDSRAPPATSKKGAVYYWLVVMAPGHWTTVFTCAFKNKMNRLEKALIIKISGFYLELSRALMFCWALSSI